MLPDDVLIELVADDPGITGHSSDPEELWNVIHPTRRFDRVYPYVEALRLARDLAREHRVDIYRRRIKGDPPELAEEFRPGAR
jgi:hypothetical protein